MKKVCILAAVAVILPLLFSCSQKKGDVSAAGGEQSETVSESAFDSLSSHFGDKKVPAVNLLDNVYIWPADGDKLADKPLSDALVIGSSITFNGKEQKFGKEQYTYANITSAAGGEGWVSAYRVAENAIPVVVIQDTFLYTLPNEASPSSIPVSAGQIAGAYIDTGKINGFVKVSYCVYYGQNKYSDRYDGFIKSNVVSSSTEDIECAQFMVRAVENPAQWADYAEFSLESHSALVRGASLSSSAVAVPFDGKTLPDDNAAAAGIVIPVPVKVVAAPVVVDGAVSSWYPVSVDKKAYIVKIDPAEGSYVNKYSGSLYVNLSNKSVQGNSVVIIQDASIKKQNADKADKLDWMASLDLGEVVTTTGKTKTFDKVDYVEVIRCDGTTGWVNKMYVCENSYPAAIATEGEAKIFQEPKRISFIKGKTITNYQIVAVNKGTSPTGWASVSYYDGKRFMTDVYVDESEVKLMKDSNLSAAILLYKLKASVTAKFSTDKRKKDYQACLATLISEQSVGYIDSSEYEKYLPAGVVAADNAVMDSSNSSDVTVSDSSDSSDEVVVTTEDAE